MLPLVCPKNKIPLSPQENPSILSAENSPFTYEILEDGIYDLLYPKELLEDDAREKVLYDKAVQRYDDGVSWVFKTLNHSDEAATRKFMIGLMHLQPGMKVLEVGAGTGKDSMLIVEQITPGGHAVLSDISLNMLRVAKKKLADKTDIDLDFFLGNGSYLPFEDESFDAVFHFGGINTFSERKLAFEEMTRVVKKGGRVVIGDESVAPWLRNEPTWATLLQANPLFRADVPLEDVPKNIENFELHWIFGGGFYVMAYTVTDKNPVVDVNMPIPNKDFVDNWKIRATQNQGN